MHEVVVTPPVLRGRQGSGPQAGPLTGNRTFVYKLPVELLSEIFLLSCTTLELPCSAGKTWMIPQVASSQVCSHWRHVALGTAKLWADVSFDFSETRNHLRMLELASAILRRTGLAPLSLVIVTDRTRPNPVPILVLPHLPHTRNLELTIPAPYFGPFYALPPGLTDVLESIEFQFIEFVLNEGPYPSMPPTVLSIAPRLATVSLQALYDLYNEDKPESPLAYRASDGLAFTENVFYIMTAGLNFAQLTTLLLATTCLSAASCHTLLKRCPNLVGCEFDITEAEDPIDETPFVMPMLRFLKIEKYMERVGMLEAFFTPLVLPSLEDFICHTYGPDEDDFPGEAFVYLLERSQCQLKVFDVSWQNIYEDHILPILRLMPSLTKLGIAQSESVFELFFDTLATEGDHLIPNLESIELRVDGEWPAADELGDLYARCPAAIVRMLQARWASPLSKLKTVDLCFWEFYPDLILTLEDLISQGFDIRMLHLWAL